MNNIMKDVLLKLSKGENNFECTIFGQKRNCKILKLDLWGLEDGKGMALVRFEIPIKKSVREEIENNIIGLDSDYHTQFQDIEIDTCEEWISIGY